MNVQAYFVLFLSLFSTSIFAQWKMVGNADYNWGPFDVYTISLYSENGKYEKNDRPLMLSLKFSKPVEGKNFAITIVKEIKSLGHDEDFDLRVKRLQHIFPDFSPNDVLSYIALNNRGYFILNDSVLDFELDSAFNNALLDVWLSPDSHFSKIRKQLIGEEKSAHSHSENLFYDPEVKQFSEEDTAPQLPPNFNIKNIDQENVNLIKDE